MQEHKNKYRLFSVLGMAALYIFIRVVESSIDWWISRQLDDLTKKDASPMIDDLTKISDWLGYITHPYILAFLIGGFIFSFPEWWPYVYKIWARLSKFVRSKLIRNEKDTTEGGETSHKIVLENRGTTSSPAARKTNNPPNILFDFASQPLGSYGSSSLRPIEAGSKENILDVYKGSICIRRFEIEITDGSPIYNASIPAKMTYYEDVPAPGGGLMCGDEVMTFNANMSIGKLLPDEPFKLWIMNRTPYHLIIELLGYIEGEAHHIGKSRFPYIFQGRQFSKWLPPVGPERSEHVDG